MNDVKTLILLPVRLFFHVVRTISTGIRTVHKIVDSVVDSVASVFGK
jgi:hypothetical protein